MFSTPAQRSENEVLRLAACAKAAFSGDVIADNRDSVAQKLRNAIDSHRSLFPHHPLPGDRCEGCDCCLSTANVAKHFHNVCEECEAEYQADC